MKIQNIFEKLATVWSHGWQIKRILMYIILINCVINSPTNVHQGNSELHSIGTGYGPVAAPMTTIINPLFSIKCNKNLLNS